MELYGIPIAVIPQKGNPNIIEVTCTPIVIADHRRPADKYFHDRFPGEEEIIKRRINMRTDFKVLDDLILKRQVDLTDQNAVFDCFIEMSNLLEDIVKRQKNSCAVSRMSYRPVSITWGEDSRAPMTADFETFFKKLFGDIYADDDGNIKEANDINDKAISPQHPMYDRYNEACTKFANNLKDCTLNFGEFTFLCDLVGTRNEEDEWLDSMKPLLDQGDEEALEALKEHARIRGQVDAETVADNPSVFQFSGPKGYKESAEMQKEMPRFTYIEWHPEIKQAYYDSYYKELTALKPDAERNHPKQPMDAANPYFTDVTADKMMSQMEILSRMHKPQVLEEKQWRKWLADSAQKAASLRL